ncbi:DUF7336 domain-containing protein [Anatilimnocola floriformis]
MQRGLGVNLVRSKNTEIAHLNRNISHNSVYILFHVREQAGNEDSKLCGVFSTEMKAMDASQQLQVVPGFRDFPNGFIIDEYLVDKVFWTEGFGFED